MRVDVAWVPQCLLFADAFQVVRRAEHVSQFGRAEIAPGGTTIAYGTLYPTGDNSLVRQADYEHSQKTMTIVTKFRLRMSAPGYQPDIVLYRGSSYIVRNVRDYTQWGAGFVEAECTSLDAQPAPPQ